MEVPPRKFCPPRTTWRPIRGNVCQALLVDLCLPANLVPGFHGFHAYLGIQAPAVCLACRSVAVCAERNWYPVYLGIHVCLVCLVPYACHVISGRQMRVCSGWIGRLRLPHTPSHNHPWGCPFSVVLESIVTTKCGCWRRALKRRSCLPAWNRVPCCKVYLHPGIASL